MLLSTSLPWAQTSASIIYTVLPGHELIASLSLNSPVFLDNNHTTTRIVSELHQIPYFGFFKLHVTKGEDAKQNTLKLNFLNLWPPQSPSQIKPPG